MFSLFKKKTAGVIRYYNLIDWWLTAFSDEERKRILELYGQNDLIEGDIFSMSGSATGYLSTMAGWFKTEKDRHIAYKFLQKAEELQTAGSVLDRHFLYQNKKDLYYRFRDVDDFAFDQAVRACEQQIALSLDAVLAFKNEYRHDDLPAHAGYMDLAIIRDKEGDTAEAIRLCELALVQGWSGDWQRRIGRYKNKLAKKS